MENNFTGGNSSPQKPVRSAKSSMASDVFLSHNSKDKPAVEEIARRLMNAGITPWLDMWNLIPGEPWQETIEEALNQCASCAVFVGPSGAGPWQNEEMRAAIDHRVRSSTGQFRVIPVFLPGSACERDDLPIFLQRHTWVEFREGLDDPDAFRRLICGIQGKAPGPGPKMSVDRGECPYRGLQFFDVNDSTLFFGREALKHRLLTKLWPTEGPRQSIRFLGILGPSGSGKSSLARAGLVAAVRNGEIEGSRVWPTLILRPGSDPVESLGIALSELYAPLSDPIRLAQFITTMRSDERALHVTIRLLLRDAAPNVRALLLVDQFEETFTVCHDEVARRAFLDNLLYAAGVVGGQAFVSIAMRTDFYGRCASHSPLANALSTSQILVDAMSELELRAAIEEPARLTGYEFEAGLVDVLLHDASKEPSALPLLQHSLLELWEHRAGNRFTHAAYKQIGGLEGALEKRAEKIFMALTPDEQAYAKRMLLRLIQPGQGTDATKRRAPVTELSVIASSKPMLDEIISRLTAPDARLLTTQTKDAVEGEPVVELSHEALIKSWKRLRDWIDEERQNLITQRRLSQATVEWVSAKRDDAYLYRGPLLVAATEWAASHSDEINPHEREFLDKSQDESAEQSRMSDAASLDQLEAAAPQAWLSLDDMALWITRADNLANGIEVHRRQLRRIQQRGKIGIDSGSIVDEERRFEHDTLALLIKRLERFERGLLAAAKHVFLISQSRNESYHFKDLWDTAIKSIETLPVYSGLRLVPQVGLIPLGLDPQSGLWEFAHLITGRTPDRDSGGQLLLQDTTCVVLVLLPGGVFSMGAKRPSPEHPIGLPNVDPYAMPDEGPVHNVAVTPFLIGKYEMTQGQWLHASGLNPSMFRPDNASTVTLRNPVECVSWRECIRTLSRIGLTLPTEAQWEYAARAGSTSVWFTGDDPDAINGKANLKQTGHTPVGAFNLPNAFGLYDIIGNVWEWCLNSFDPYPDECAVAETAIPTHDIESDSFMPGSRGGSFFNDATFARSAIRYFRTLPDARFNNRGLRPCKLLARSTFEY